MRIVFFGTPEFAVPTLKELIACKNTSVVAAVTQPDRKAGRGQKVQASPVKLTCEQHNIPVFQPEKLSKAPEVVESLRKLEPDLIVMVAFGQILKKEILSLPKYGVINLHFSLLPAYRGAAPVNWAIINGDTISGASTMFTEAGLDTGPMLLKEELPIDVDTNAQEYGTELANRGAKLVIKTIEQLVNGSLIPEKQNDTQATYAPLLTKELGKIDWSKSAKSIHNLVRGLIPWPLAHTIFRDQQIKIWRTAIVDNEQSKILSATLSSLIIGQLCSHNKSLYVYCGENSWLEIKEVQAPNKAKVSAYNWVNGIHLQNNEKFVL